MDTPSHEAAADRFSESPRAIGLARAAAHGDRAALHELCTLLRPELEAYARFIAPPGLDDAESLVSAMLLEKLIERSTLLRAVASGQYPLGPALRKTLKRYVADVKRRRKGERVVSFERVDPPAGVAAPAPASDVGSLRLLRRRAAEALGILRGAWPALRPARSSHASALLLEARVRIAQAFGGVDDLAGMTDDPPSVLAARTFPWRPAESVGLIAGRRLIDVWNEVGPLLDRAEGACLDDDVAAAIGVVTTTYQQWGSRGRARLARVVGEDVETLRERFWWWPTRKRRVSAQGLA